MSNDIFPKEVRNAAEKMGGDWYKGSDFDGEGQIVQVAKAMEVVRSNNPLYGAVETDFLVKQEIIEEGQTLRFTFKTASDGDKRFDTKSAPFFIAFKQCEELGVGDWVKITRTGKTDKTRYEVVKVDAPEVATGQPEVGTTQPADYPESAGEVAF